MAAPDEESGTRAVVTGLVALVVVSLLVGGVVAVLAYGATRVAGLGDVSVSGSTAEPSLVMPSGTPTTRPQAYPDPPGRPSAAPSSPQSSPSESRSKRRKPRPISLEASPRRVGAGERINLSGSYRNGDGATLQVQRRDAGAWVPFGDVTTSVSDGSFGTYIFTSRTGRNRLRVQDTASGKVSNAVTVRVG